MADSPTTREGWQSLIDGQFPNGASAISEASSAIFQITWFRVIDMVGFDPVLNMYVAGHSHVLVGRHVTSWEVTEDEPLSVHATFEDADSFTITQPPTGIAPALRRERDSLVAGFKAEAEAEP